ncbi:MAG: hypothetical protein ACXAD7_24405 [Candidatus Kariarchaeaceae archaeon]|jgi:hypothetical protein
MEKKIKPYGKVFSQGREYYLLEPHPRKMSDGTFEFLVVPYFDPETDFFVTQPVARFVRATQFLSEHSDHKVIRISVSELEE